MSSAGTGPWHVGDDMDRRSRSTLEQSGYAVAAHVAQQFDVSGFTRYDLVVALDGGHLRELRAMADRTPDPAATRAAIVLLGEFDPQLLAGEDPDVGDPYYGGESGFVDVLDPDRAQLRGPARRDRARRADRRRHRVGSAAGRERLLVALVEGLDAVEAGRPAGAEGIGLAGQSEQRRHRLVQVGGGQDQELALRLG